MGGPMVRRIIRAGWPVALWARRPNALEPFTGRGVEVSANAAALAASTDLIEICVWADDDVREVLTGAQGVLEGARPGTIVAVHSTILPSTCRELADAAAQRGVSLIDAPVTGGPNLALAGELTVAAGGDQAALTRSRPVFDAFAATVMRLGDVGAGQVAKLLNNALLAANVVAADDALTIGERLGLNAAELAAFLTDGSGRSYGVEVAERCRMSHDVRAAVRTSLEKDVNSLAIETAGDDVGTVLQAAAAAAVRRLA
jgi:3-hydroxyisobutyrate dehydrogenase